MTDRQENPWPVGPATRRAGTLGPLELSRPLRPQRALFTVTDALAVSRDTQSEWSQP